MKEVNLTEVFQKFDRGCFELAKDEYYTNFEEFFHDVLGNHARWLMDIYDYDEDRARKGIREYLEDYYYRDPVTDIQKTFLEWSSFFNNKYRALENLMDLYEDFAKKNEELDSYKSQVKKLKSEIKDYQSQIEELTSMLEDEEAEEDNNFATYDEMKEEALQRMKSVIQYEPIIEAFEEDDMVQVYEPPYGASYALEEDELERVKNIESRYNVLVWGVIRCFKQYNGENATVDCMLHVSRNKDEWEQERKDLLDGNPFVFTTVKEFRLEDHGHINIYTSVGGTLLRR